MNLKSSVRIGLGLVLGSVLMGCAMKPSIILEAEQYGPDISFDIRAKGINGLVDLRIWQTDTKEVIWQINLNSFNGPRLGYGEVPVGFKTFNGGSGNAKQVVPSGDKRPSPLPAGKSFILVLGVQYDTMMSAAMRPFYFSFSTDSEGRISAIMPVATPRPEDQPN